MLDRRRIRQLRERESAALDERTGGSAAMFRRARRVLAGGVASSFQAREPWPIYFGSQPELRVDGVPVGRLIAETSPASRSAQPGGSCIAVVATDAPLSSAQLSRVARRAGLGLARTGSVGHHHSGEMFLACSTSARSPATEYGDDLDPLFSATVDATEEAVLNVLWTATRTEGRQGHVVEALPHEAVLELLAAHRRLEG